jgi:outer membrane murein-binding lipoprotein Lpp
MAATTITRVIAAGIVGLLLLAGCTSANVHAGSKLDTDLQYIAGQVGLVQSAITDYISTPNQANLDQMAQAAQMAHDQINQWKDNIGIDGNSNSHALDAQVAAGDLKNAMGALVAYSGNPNAATLASLTTQFDGAVGEWNSAITALYAHVKSSEPPPTINCPSC